MVSIGGFWSYVHADDEAEGGRIVQLAHDLIAEFELMTGEPIDLFLDRDGIQWGDDWRDKIDQSLASVAFFIPTLTPKYFASAECRRELQFFIRRATELGLQELVLPLLYVDVPRLREESPDDDLVSALKRLQWVDWTDLRFAPPDSEAYRRAVGRLAARLIEANAQAERTSVTHVEEAPDTTEYDDTPGWLDRAAETEAAFPAWSQTMEAITREVAAIGQIMEEGAAETQRRDAAGQGLAARLTVARRMSQELTGPADSIRSHANEFAARLHTIDDGLRALIEQAPLAIEQDPLAKAQVCEFFGLIEELARTADESFGKTRGLLESFEPIERASRDLRRSLRSLREGLTIMLEAREVAGEWTRLIDQSGVACDEVR